MGGGAFESERDILASQLRRASSGSNISPEDQLLKENSAYQGLQGPLFALRVGKAIQNHALKLLQPTRV